MYYNKKDMKKANQKSLFLIFGLLLAIIVIYSLVFVNFDFVKAKSIHEDAKKYTKGSCLVYYPNSDDGKQYAKSVCTNKDNEGIFDYTLVPYGDYYLVKYGDGTSYFTDKNYKEIELTKLDISAKKIISDYLRYEIKKNYPEKYTLSFIEQSTKNNIDLNSITYKIENSNFVLYLPDYDLTLKIPLKYMQAHLQMNFGYPNEQYIKPIYIDDSKPYVVLTFEDGPYYGSGSSSDDILNILEEYDVNATFFVRDENLDDNPLCLKQLKDSIANGNEYGYHNDDYLSDISNEEILNLFTFQKEFFQKNFSYEPKCFRPAGGIYTDEIVTMLEVPAIIWEVDTQDWYLESVDEIVDIILDNANNGVIYALHDIYSDTAKVVEKVVPELISRGYQIITVENALRIEGYNYNNITAWY